MKFLYKNLALITLGIFYSLAACFPQAALADAFLVKDKKPMGAIIAASSAESYIQKAVVEFIYHVERSTGAVLPVVDPKNRDRLSKDTVQIIIGDKENAFKDKEKFRVKFVGNTLTFTGDGGQSDALLWAVGYYLDTQLGVRWLWPGEVGTYVPQRADIPLVAINYEGRPIQGERNFRINSLKKAHERSGIPRLLSSKEYKQQMAEANQWLARYQMGKRDDYSFGHSFTKWWERYGKEHPEYFAEPPTGSDYKQPWPSAKFVKLRIGNPAIDDAIINEWKAAGAPDLWRVAPNDGEGFDTSEASRAMDDPPHQDPQLIWRKDANLTARYVKFWNRLIEKMREINPNVKLTSYAYSVHRYPPPQGLKVNDGIVIGFVHSYWDQESWRGWQEAGVQSMYLRPNWWYVGGVAPVIPLHKQGEFFKFAQNHSMIGFDFDSLMGYWATQGPMYYLIARLSVRPDLSVDEVIDEYCSAFGGAASDIKEYLDYWENLTDSYGYAAATSKPPTYPPTPRHSIVKELTEKYNLDTSYLGQGWQVIPYLYKDDVLDKGYAILDRAEKNAVADNDFVRQRVQFLREGLDHLKLTRDVIEQGNIKQRSSAQQEKYYSLAKQLQKMRHSLTLKNAIWGEAEYSIEKTRKIPTIAISNGESAQKRMKKSGGFKNVKVLHDLDIDWKFSPDPQNDGLRRGVEESTFDDSSWQSVTGTTWWQSQGYSDYRGVAWYRKKFDIGKLDELTVYLDFGAIDGDAVVYLNGKQVTEHKLGKAPNFKGWNKPFSVDVTKALSIGENVVAVQVISKSSGSSGMTGGASIVAGR